MNWGHAPIETTNRDGRFGSELTNAVIVPAFFDNDTQLAQRGALLRDFEQRDRAQRLTFAPRVERDGASLALTGSF